MNRERMIAAIVLVIVVITAIGIGVFVTNKQAKAEEAERQKVIVQIEKQQEQEEKAIEAKKDAPYVNVEHSTAVNKQSINIAQGIGHVTTALTDSDIQRLQSYPQYSSVNGVKTGELYTSFQDMYKNRLPECEAAMNKFSPLKLSNYTNAKVNWLSSPKLVYYSAEGQYCIRGVLDLTFYDEDNKFNLKSNQEYQVDAEYRIEASIINGVKSISLDKTIYLSDFKAVK